MIEKLLEETWAEILAIRNALSDYAGKLFVKNSEGRWELRDGRRDKKRSDEYG